MLTRPYRLVSAEGVSPGCLLEHDGAVFVVDEVRRTSDGLTFLGWPWHRRGRGRRASFEVKAGDRVMALPADARERDALRAALVNAVTEAVRSWSEGAGTEQASIAPWAVEDGGAVLELRAAGCTWRVGFDVAYLADYIVDAEIVDDLDEIAERGAVAEPDVAD